VSAIAVMNGPRIDPANMMVAIRFLDHEYGRAQQYPACLSCSCPAVPGTSRCSSCAVAFAHVVSTVQRRWYEVGQVGRQPMHGKARRRGLLRRSLEVAAKWMGGKGRFFQGMAEHG